MSQPNKISPIPCDPKEIALKSFFLGPQSENAPWVSDLLREIFSRWVEWRKSLFPQDGVAISEHDQNTDEFLSRRQKFKKVAHELVTRFESEVPKFSPRYVGHMFSEISLPALMGHIITLLHNPNNISGESSRVGIKIEEEAVNSLLSMVGYSTELSTGHFTSGGTVANLEALTRAYSRYSLWLAAEAVLKSADSEHDFHPFQAAHSGWNQFDSTSRVNEKAGRGASELAKWDLSLSNPLVLCRKIEQLSAKEFLGPVILVPDNLHYSWKKGCQLLGLGRESLWPIQLDDHGRLMIRHLGQLLDLAVTHGRPILLVVSVVGTTELGGIDPVDEVQDLLDKWEKTRGVHIWHHVDAAYGGLFRTLNLNETKVLPDHGLRSLTAIQRTTSITLDPHKLGYVPYASGAFLARAKRDYYFSAFEDAPYIDFDETTDHGPYTIEGSRSAAGAVATWMAAKTMGLNSEGYGLLLERTIRIRKSLAAQILKSDLSIQIAPGCDTNVLCFTCAGPGESISDSNRRTLKVFEAFSPRGNGDFIVSKTSLRWKAYNDYLNRWTTEWNADRDADEVVLIRMCMMNPFFGSVETDVDYAQYFIQSLRTALQ